MKRRAFCRSDGVRSGLAPVLPPMAAAAVLRSRAIVVNFMGWFSFSIEGIFFRLRGYDDQEFADRQMRTTNFTVFARLPGRAMRVRVIAVNNRAAVMSLGTM